MHPEAYAFVARTVASLSPRRAVVDLGGRDVNGSPRRLFKDAKRYVAVDMRDGPGVDVVAGATQYQPRFKADTVVCCETLEHTDLGAEIIANAYRILQPGGVLILTAAGEGRAEHSAVDGMALRAFEHYGNIGAVELRCWMEAAGFEGIEIENDTEVHDVRALGLKVHA